MSQTPLRVSGLEFRVQQHLGFRGWASEFRVEGFHVVPQRAVGRV